MVRIDAVTLKQLRCLKAILEAGTLTAAAERLAVTAPAVSTQLRNLEANVGAPVLLRGPNGEVALTAAGEQVLATAQQVDAALTACAHKLNALSAGHAGQVAVGVVSTGKYFAPGLIVRARAAMPSVDLALRIGNRAQILAALSEHAIDVAIMGRAPTGPSFLADPLGPHPYVLIVAPDHAFAGRTEISAEDLLSQTFLSREIGSGTRMLAQNFLDQFGAGRPYETIELGSNETIKQGVIAGLGIAIISAHTVAAELATGRLALAHVAGLPILRQWFLVRPAGAKEGAATGQFRQFLQSLADDFLPKLPA